MCFLIKIEYELRRKLLLPILNNKYGFARNIIHSRLVTSISIF